MQLEKYSPFLEIPQKVQLFYLIKITILVHSKANIKHKAIRITGITAIKFNFNDLI